MTDITETQQEDTPVLEGEYEQSSQKTKLFSNITALCDYIDSFKITNGQFQKGVMRDTGKSVYQLNYVQEE